VHDPIYLINQSLKQRGYSLTKPRKLVFLALLNQEPITMNELIARVGENVNRASVYRTIKLFESLGATQKIQIGWKYKIELSNKFHKHHHHISCLNCGLVVPFQETKNFNHELTSIANKLNFKLTNHQIELIGLCINCQKTRTPAHS
jgi:Fe2+ or Zn2+ uptake regulation protein